MMYSNRFVVSVKVGGKILRETNGSVSLPFGSEYGLILKNLNSRRAMAKVTVDGVDATEGTKLILPANGSIDLERFIKNGNLDKGNKFKFIERSEAVENHRGIKEDDGLVRVEFFAEKEVLDVPVVRKHYYDDYVPFPKPWYPAYPVTLRPWWDNGIVYCNNVQATGGEFYQSSAQATYGQQNMLRCQSVNMSEASLGNDAGITVPGSESNQKFYSASGFDLESNSTVIVLQLKGVVGKAKVSAPVTVDFKPSCVTCGKTNKASDSFCSGCGTSLKVF